MLGIEIIDWINWIDQNKRERNAERQMQRGRCRQTDRQTETENARN